MNPLGVENKATLTWYSLHAKPVTKGIAEMVAIPGQKIVGIPRPLLTQVLHNGFHPQARQFGPSQRYTFSVGVHGVPFRLTGEDTCTIFAIAK